SLPLRRVLARALAKAPEDRYPSTGDLGRAALAAAEGRSVTEEERSVARGAAAPRTRRRTAPEPREAPVKRYRTRTRTRRAWIAARVALAAAALAYVVVAPSGGSSSAKPGDPVSATEMTRLANAFADAYRNEDSTRLSRLLTSDARRVTATDRERGRADVV